MSPLEPPAIPDGFLRRWCETLAESSESPPGAFLPSGLAVLSATVGPRLVMRWQAAHEERMNLWVLNVGMSALARKTSGLSGLRESVKWMRDGADDLVRMLPVSRISDAGLVAALDVVGPETAAAQAAADDGVEVEEVVRPVPLSWIAVFNEVAPIWMDDGPGWAMDAQRMLLTVYDGHLSSGTRATRVPSQECFVTAIGNIPPGVLREQTTLSMLSSGFVGRWLVIPTPPPDRYVAFPRPNGRDPLDALRMDVEHLMRLARLRDRVEVNGLWGEEPEMTREGWYARHWHALRESDPDDAMQAAYGELWGRLQATAVKVATLTAISEQIDALDDLAELRVHSHNVQWASDVVDASISYMTETLLEAGAESESQLGKTEGKVLRYLERSGATSEQSARTLTQIADAVKGPRTTRGEVVRVIDDLLQGGNLVAAEEQHGVRVRRMVWLSGSGVR